MTRHRRPRRWWTEEEISWLTANYVDFPVGEIAKRFSRSHQAINNKLSQLRLPARKILLAARDETPVGQIVSSPIPVPLAMLRLAEFDPVVRRAVRDRRAGKTKPTMSAGEALRDITVNRRPTNPAWGWRQFG